MTLFLLGRPWLGRESEPLLAVEAGKPNTVRSKSVDKRLYRRLFSRLMGTITRVKVDQPLAALTFDDGPHPEYTPRLLEILASYGASATFFMVGEAAKSQPDLVRQVAEAGHAIGNHSWSHVSFPTVSWRERRAQVQSCAAELAPFEQRLFRPPHGHQTLRTRFDLWRLGYQVVTWNIAPQDWLDYPAAQLVDRVIEQLSPGSIILFHDSLFHTEDKKYTDREPTLKAVESLLKQLSGDYQFVTLPALFQAGNPVRGNWLMTGDQTWLRRLGQPTTLIDKAGMS
jgi:peptidoglycan/xylan/chitin deacetylase (PgdA/CDA1 family)